MFMEKEVREIRAYIEKSDRPLFFFDDDTDGLCSYLLLRALVNEGKGVVVKSSPVLDTPFLKKVTEYCPDIIFVLDKPIISQEFIDKVSVPLIWIDHHTPVKRSGVRYYNPRLLKKDMYYPTSYICYNVAQQRLWVGMVGIVGDYLLPDELKIMLEKEYPGLLGKAKDIDNIIYDSDLGRLIRMFSFLLKGKTSDVNKSINILLRIENPYELLMNETPRAKFLVRRFEKINKEYEKLMDSALGKHTITGKIFLFVYPSTKMSFSVDLSNELSHRYPDKIVVVGRVKDDMIRMSLRSKKYKISEYVEKAIEGLEGYGGGHEHACGSNIKKEDLDEYIRRLVKLTQRLS